MYHHILIAIEHSQADKAVLEHIEPLARMTGAKLLLVHVADGWAARYFEELKLHEIATVLDLTESRVSQIRSKALGKLRGELKPLREHVA